MAPAPELSLRGAKRRGNLGKAVAFSPGLSCYPPRYCEIATAPLGPRNDKSGAFTIVTATGTSRSCGAGRGQPGPYKARAFARRSVQIGSAFPRLPRAQSALAMTNLLALRHRIRAAKPTACKAVTDRRYRRNWCIPFSRRPVRIGSLAKLSTFHFLFSTRRMPSPYNAPSMPPPFPSASSHTCFASSTARGRRIIPARPNRR